MKISLFLSGDQAKKKMIAPHWKSWEKKKLDSLSSTASARAQEVIPARLEAGVECSSFPSSYKG